MKMLMVLLVMFATCGIASAADPFAVPKGDPFAVSKGDPFAVKPAKASQCPCGCGCKDCDPSKPCDCGCPCGGLSRRTDARGNIFEYRGDKYTGTCWDTAGRKWVNGKTKVCDDTGCRWVTEIPVARPVMMQQVVNCGPGG